MSPWAIGMFSVMFVLFAIIIFTLVWKLMIVTLLVIYTAIMILFVVKVVLPITKVVKKL